MEKSRNSCNVRSGGVGANGIVTKGQNQRGPETSIKRSCIIFQLTSSALVLIARGIKLLKILILLSAARELSECHGEERSVSSTFKLKMGGAGNPKTRVKLWIGVFRRERHASNASQ